MNSAWFSILARLVTSRWRDQRDRTELFNSESLIFEVKMTIDKSLKVRRGMIANRNVLTRIERIAKLQEQDRWNEGDSVLGLPKVRVQKVSLKKKKKVKKEEDE
jgi:small basic protein (TIGR04137 family)